MRVAVCEMYLSTPQVSMAYRWIPIVISREAATREAEGVGGNLDEPCESEKEGRIGNASPR